MTPDGPIRCLVAGQPAWLRRLKFHTPRLLLAAALLWTAGSTLAAYPHQLAYFNELAGGPENGHRHLLGSSFDWGQDVFIAYRASSTRGIDDYFLKSTYSPSVISPFRRVEPDVPRSESRLIVSREVFACDAYFGSHWWRLRRVTRPTGPLKYVEAEMIAPTLAVATASPSH